MEKNYWLRRWEKHETGFHQLEVEPELIKHFSQIQPTRVLVPLCGKSLDLKWLRSQGHEVIGVELSALACKEFFTDNQIQFQQSTEGHFEVFRGDGITLYCGDFFNFEQDLLGEIGALYDRAALIALPSDLRSKYAAHITKLVNCCSKKDGFRFLQISIELTPPPSPIAKPPFSISAQEIENLYGKSFNIHQLEREIVSEPKAIPVMVESVYELEPKTGN
ncbi:MAG: thiopurine S-methyltransferase [Bdellovibrionia bacterium]